jgi:hypothetical protein
MRHFTSQNRLNSTMSIAQLREPRRSFWALPGILTGERSRAIVAYAVKNTTTLPADDPAGDPAHNKATRQCQPTAVP